MHPTSLLRVAALVGGLLFSGCQCTTIVYKPLKGDLRQARPILPLPPQYYRWWRQVEQCSGIRKPMRSVTFWIIAKDYFKSDTGMFARAYWGLYVLDTAVDNGEVLRERIYLAAPVALTDWLVKHEMLHALVGRDSIASPLDPWHPPLYFRDKCALLPEQHIDGYQYPPIAPPMDSIPQQIIQRIPHS